MIVYLLQSLKSESVGMYMGIRGVDVNTVYRCAVRVCVFACLCLRVCEPCVLFAV